MKAQTQSASSVRRLGVFNAIRNCCFNIADQTLVLSPGMYIDTSILAVDHLVFTDDCVGYRNWYAAIFTTAAHWLGTFRRQCRLVHTYHCYNMIV